MRVPSREQCAMSAVTLPQALFVSGRGSRLEARPATLAWDFGHNGTENEEHRSSLWTPFVDAPITTGSACSRLVTSHLDGRTLRTYSLINFSPALTKSSNLRSLR